VGIRRHHNSTSFATFACRQQKISYQINSLQTFGMTFDFSKFVTMSTCASYSFTFGSSRTNPEYVSAHNRCVLITNSGRIT
jgi:hypothetical protein